ncbi:MAG: cobalt ECF transporter T component CbiQ [Dermatophilaceae bacterium]
MGREHGHTLHYHGHSSVHRMPAHLKILALLGYTLLVVATPRETVWPYAVHLGTLAVAVRASGVPAAYLLRRLVVEAPFAGFALLMPLVASGPRVEVAGVSLSEAGLAGAWALLAKGTLGVLASLLLAATTEPRDLLVGLARLRVPRQLVEIAGFMIRYVDVIADEARRMRIARTSRGFVARSPRQWPVLGRSVGVLFVRAYERGERVHLAMLSRGYAGSLPTGGAPAVAAGQWMAAAVLPAAALVTAAAAWRLR